MPTYEYACEKCRHEFEAEQRITDDPVKTCPKCRSRKVKRLISQTSFVLKGGGWYSDLYASPGGADKKPDAKDKSPESKETSSDTKDKGSTDSTSKESSKKSKSEKSGSGKGSKAVA
jgi:putative FmdB family regulatory protein